jgi:DNA-binding transcriptional LysR family regulator
MVIGMADHQRPSSAALNQLRVRHLRLAQALVSVGSLHKAARQLHISQPTASALLKELERAFGGQLFDRSRKGVTPGLRGRSAIARLNAVLGELDILSEEMAAEEAVPVLRIGCLYHAFFGPLQDYLRDFLTTTACRVEIVDGAVPDLMQRLQRNELDCVLARMPASALRDLRRSTYFYQPLYEFQVCILAGPAHPLLGKRKLELRNLAPYEWILSKSATILKDAFAAAGLEPPRVRIETSSFVFALPLLRVGHYLTTAPRDAGLEQQRLGLARILPIKLPELLTPVAFIAQRSTMLNPNVAQLWNAIRKAANPGLGAQAAS